MILLSISGWTDPGVLVSIITTFFAVVLGILSIIIQIFSSRKTLFSPRKEMIYQVLEDSSIGRIDENLLSLKIWNSGKTDVTIRNAVEVDNKAYDEPIKFIFTGRTVVKVTELETDPKDGVLRYENRKEYLLNPSPQPDSIGLPKIKLRPRQSMSLSVLLKGPKGKVIPIGSSDGVGLRPFEEVQQKKDHRRQLILFSSVSLVTFVLVLAIILGTLSAVQSVRINALSTIPSTLNVTVEIDEEQNVPISNITLGFSSNTTIPPNTTIFTNGESVSCKNQIQSPNNSITTITLGNAASYLLHLAIPYNSSYICDYHYILNGKKESATIFSFHAAQYPLSPVLLRPVNGNFQVHYTPGLTITNSSNCTVQVTANAPNQSASGDTVPQKGNMYTGSDASGLNGMGNIVMIRSCIPVNSSSKKGGLSFNVNVTYTSVATSPAEFP